MPSLEFETEKNAFHEYYSSNAALLSSAAESLRALIVLLLSDSDDFPTPQQVLARVKDREECIAKFKRKYLSDCEKEGKPFEIRPYITDLVGLRVVCLYESDIEHVRQILSEEFSVLDETDKSRVLESQDNAFGYKGVHLDLRISSSRKSLPEYRRFQDLQFEVQIRSVVQDAWSVLDHKIKYKKEIPKTLKRRINRLAALFELADQEFQHIRDETTQLEEAARAKATKEATRPIESTDPVYVDAFTMLSTLRERFSNYNFFPHKVDGFAAEILEVEPKMTLKELLLSLDETAARVGSYVNYQAESFLNRLNPYTQVRHALYLKNPAKFGSLLFDIQRRNFDKWLRANQQV